MNREELRLLLEAIQKGNVDVETALERLRTLPYEDLGFAKIDHHRSLRRGYPEVVYCEGKTPEQVARIMERMAQTGENVMATRAAQAHYKAVREVLPEADYLELPRIILLKQKEPPETEGVILVVSAGTADLPVAEEAAVTARMLGNKVDRLYDVGVAGLHRLLGNTSKLMTARVIIVVAGMEGALASVIRGMVEQPVVGVPTSTGYGASFSGLSALLTMLNSCSAGIGVVNIDNGFGAGVLASLINKLGEGSK